MEQAELHAKGVLLAIEEARIASVIQGENREAAIEQRLKALKKGVEDFLTAFGNPENQELHEIESEAQLLSKILSES